MDKYLVLGSNSFSGSNFCSWLVNHGHHVFATSRSNEAAYEFLPYRWRDANPRNFTFAKIDLNHDIGDLKKIVHSFRPHYIVNFAAQSMVAQSWHYPQHWVETNVLAVTNLIEMLKNYDEMKKFIQVTTPEVYGSTESKIDESAEIAPSTPYAVTRAAGDMLLKAYHDQIGFPVDFTRAANVYGAGQQLYRIIPRTILACLSEKRLRLDGGGLSERSFIHIDDVCAATMAICEMPDSGNTYHISTDKFVSIRDLVAMIVDKLGESFNKVVELVDERPGKDQAYFLDSKKLREKTGWSDTVSLEKGLEQTINWFKQHQVRLKSFEENYVHKP